ncbi:hypothetical protein IL306_013547 [Fusarium sp. DS 682]|nr:hypothetical protein IL306_013547 [Fusarium sp. DS 682]
MTVDMGVTIQQLTNAQAAQLAGLAMGCLFFIPLAVKYGRRSSYIISTAVMAGVTWWTSKMTTNAELIITMVITGLAGAINETSVQMTISDLFFVHHRGSANAFYFGAVMVGSFLTPMAAGTQAAHEGWRWSYYTLAICLTILSVITVFAFEETKYIPLSVGQVDNDVASFGQSSVKEDIDSKNKVDGDAATIATQTEPAIPMNSYRQCMRWTTTTSENLPRLFMMPFYVITLPHVMFTALQFASGICWLVVFMQVISIVFAAPPYNFSTAGIGYMSLGPFVGNLFGSIYGGPLADWTCVRLAKRNGGVFEPEMRLYPLVIPTFFSAGGLIMFGATCARGMHWIYPSIGGAFFAFGLGAMGDITFTLIIDTYRELVAEAFIGIAFMRNALSIGATFALVPWMKTQGLTNMFIVCGCISFAIGALYVPLIIYGKRIRTTLALHYWKLVEKRSRI